MTDDAIQTMTTREREVYDCLLREYDGALIDPDGPPSSRLAGDIAVLIGFVGRLPAAIRHNGPFADMQEEDIDCLLERVFGSAPLSRGGPYSQY